VETYSRARQAPDGNIILHVHFLMLDKQGYGCTLSVCNTYYLSMATVVLQTHLNVTFLHTFPVLFLLEGELHELVKNT
jgi:hypothetical protein